MKKINRAKRNELVLSILSSAILTISVESPLSLSRAEGAEHSNTNSMAIHLINPAAIGPGMVAGVDLDAAISKFACAARPRAPVDCVNGARAAEALGMTADGAAALVVQLNTNETNAPLVMSVSNEATLVTYDPNFRNYAPLPGSTTLTFQPSQFSQCSGQPCVLAIIQAPDILKQGPGGGYPDLTQPITLTVQIGNNEPATAQVALDPPPVMLVHGLWGTSSSLANVQSYLSQQASFASLPSYFIDAIQYTNDIAFDDSTVEQVVTNAIQNFTTSLTDNNIAFGRIDLVAHSMGGLVARHYSSTSGYVGSQNRQLGYFHSVAVIDTPEAGSLLATFLVDNATVGFSKHASSLAKLVKKKGCGTAATVSGCFATNGENLAPPGQPVTAGAV